MLKTIIPMFTSYLPISFIFLGPLLTGRKQRTLWCRSCIKHGSNILIYAYIWHAGISFGGMGTICLMSTQIFPMIDPYLVLFFVQGSVVLTERKRQIGMADCVLILSCCLPNEQERIRTERGFVAYCEKRIFCRYRKALPRFLQNAINKTIERSKSSTSSTSVVMILT